MKFIKKKIKCLMYLVTFLEFCTEHFIQSKGKLVLIQLSVLRLNLISVNCITVIKSNGLTKIHQMFGHSVRFWKVSWPENFSALPHTYMKMLIIKAQVKSIITNFL